MLKHCVEQVPIENCIVVLQILLIIARHPALRDTLINIDAIDIICFLLEVQNKSSHFSVVLVFTEKYQISKTILRSVEV